MKPIKLAYATEIQRIRRFQALDDLELAERQIASLKSKLSSWETNRETLLAKINELDEKLGVA